MTTPAEYTWKSIELAPKDGTAVMELSRDAVTTAVYCHQFKRWDLVERKENER